MYSYFHQASDRDSIVIEKPAGDMVLRQITSFIIVLFLALAPTQAAYAKGNDKYASMTIDADTGAVLSERYADKRVYPASLTKVMTLLLLFEAMESGNVRLNDKIRISQRAASQQPSKLGLAAGSSIRVEDAILALVTKSANDISVAIAEHLGGTEDRFALRMTRRAHDIGMVRTTYKNAHGLHNPGQITTARDQLTLARYVITRYPNYYRYFSTKQFTYRGKTYTNHNRLMNSYPGMDGFKTGFINASGFNLIASSKRNGRRVIGVVFGGRSWKTRNDHMAELLNTAFAKVGSTRYAQNAPKIPVANVTAPLPLPVAKPELQQAPQNTAVAAANPPNYTSLAALDQSRKAVAQPNTLQLPSGYAETDTTEKAIADVRSAINSGAYSELTGQGDFDAATTRRVEAGLLSAAVYKGEHDRVKKIQMASAMIDAGIKPEAAPAVRNPAAPYEKWSIQIGAYNSRVATDDALRRAHLQLPSTLIHAKPIVVPLNTGEGMLFRARLGNFTKEQAAAACQHFQDCLPIAPR